MRRFLANYAYINLNDQLTRVPGIGSVQVFGAGQYAMRLWVKPDQLAKLQITVPEIVSAIQAQNTVNPAGTGGQRADSQGSGIHLLGSRAGPPDLAGRVRADRGSRNSRTAASCACTTWRAWNWARRTTASPAASTESRAPSSRSISCPARMPCRPPRASRKLLAEAKKRFPDDVDYAIPLDTTRAVTEGIKEIVETLLIAIALVVVVVYLFLQGWRATLIPLLAVPVSLIGTFIFFPLFGFSINTLSLFGLVLGHRPGGGRRHRGRGSGGAPHRRRSGSQSSRLQGHGGDLGSRDRHRAGPFRGVRSHGVHPRHHRPALSAVRRDHRDLRDPVGVQRAHAQSRAGGAAAEAEDGEQRAAGGVLRLVQPDLRSAAPTPMSACPAC